MSTSSESPIRILLIDSHTLIRAGLRMLVESQAGFAVVGETGCLVDALTLASEKNPDIILLELDGAQELGLESIPRLLAAASQARLILVTDDTAIEAQRQCAQFGAMGVVLKDQPPAVLIKAITKVHNGEAWFDRSMVAGMLTQLSRARLAPETNPEAEKIAALSDKEREVIALLGQGLKNKEIAERLCLSEVTVRHRLTSIFSKLGISDRLELILYALQHDLAQLPR